MDFKKCFKEKEIVVYLRKRIRLKHGRWCKYQERSKSEQNIHTNEYMGSFIKLILRWFSQRAISKRFWILRKVLLIAALPQSKIAIPLWKFFIDLSLCVNRPFGFSAHASLFLGCFFFILFSFFLLFHCAFKNLNFVQNEWNFHFPKEETL